jgi:DNA invertase Pin-like site-specific DNA recombinase
MEKICFEPPEVFVPTESQIDILRAVAERQGCRIAHVVDVLRSSRSESSVRSGIRVLLSKRYLDGGKSSSEIVLRLTSRGRLLLQPVDAR